VALCDTARRSLALPLDDLRNSYALTWDFVGAPSATRTRDLLLRRHRRLSAVQTCEDALQMQAKPLKAVVPQSDLRRRGDHGTRVHVTTSSLSRRWSTAAWQRQYDCTLVQLAA